MTTISAQTILRSRNKARPDKVLSTILCRYPRPIHAELMTHRQFSRNAASSRAIPVEKLIQDVRNDTFIPVYWGMNQKGMQASRELPKDLIEEAKGIWLEARDRALEQAELLSYMGVLDGKPIGAHKQIINRLLEPFAHITVLVSSTEWSNFLALRDHEAAEPHIQILARAIHKELEREDNIQDLKPGEWHLPFIKQIDREAAWNFSRESALSWEERNAHTLNLLIKLASACCASTSYKTVDGFDMTLERADEIYAKLVEKPPLHASPFEHVAQADGWTYQDSFDNDRWHNPEQHGNFVGFRQYRKMLPNECL